ATGCLLRRHIAWSPHHDSITSLMLTRFCGRVGHLGDTEIEHLDQVAPVVVDEHDVVGFEIAMDHALLMRGDEPFARLNRDSQRTWDTERTDLELPTQTLARDVLQY